MLDALAAVNMHVMVAMPHVLNNSVDVNASTWPAFEQELLGNMSMVMHHPALAGCAACFGAGQTAYSPDLHRYYVCDDCASGSLSVQRNRSVIVDIMRRHDPYHLIYGAGGGPQGELETEDETVDGSEPASLRALEHGLVLDVPMVENYRNDLGFHESDGGNDNSFRRPPSSFEVIVNMPGPMRQFGHEGLETMVWIGIIVANAPWLNWFVFRTDLGSRQQIEIAVETVNLKVQELMPSFSSSARHDERQPVVNVTTRLPNPCNAQQPDPYGCPPGASDDVDAHPQIVARMFREDPRNSSAACSHLIVANAQGINAPFSLTISGLTDAEVAAATRSGGGFAPLFDGSCVNNPANYGGQGTKLNQPDYLCRRVLATKANGGMLVLSDWIAASKTNIYALGCVEKEDLITTPWSNRGNLVVNGNMEIVNGLPGQPGCVVFNAGCMSMWGVMPGTWDQAKNRTIWTDGRAKVHISTVSPHRGRHSLRINSPKPRQTLRVGIPGDGIKAYNLSSTLAAGQKNVPNCLFNQTRYELEAFVRASSQSWRAEQGQQGLGRVWLSFGRQKFNNSDYNVPHFEPWSEETAVLGTQLDLTTQWQRLRVVLPPQEWPCTIDLGPHGSQANAWEAPLYGRGQPWPWHLELAFEGGAGPQQFWLDSVVLLANQSLV